MYKFFYNMEETIMKQQKATLRRAVTALAVATAMTFSPFSHEKCYAKEIIFGDVNGDSVVTADDANMVLLDYLYEFMGDTEYVRPFKLYIADVDGNGVITADDATLILRNYLIEMLEQREAYFEIESPLPYNIPIQYVQNQCWYVYSQAQTSSWTRPIAPDERFYITEYYGENWYKVKLFSEQNEVFINLSLSEFEDFFIFDKQYVDPTTTTTTEITTTTTETTTTTASSETTMVTTTTTMVESEPTTATTTTPIVVTETTTETTTTPTVVTEPTTATTIITTDASELTMSSTTTTTASSEVTTTITTRPTESFFKVADYIVFNKVSWNILDSKGNYTNEYLFNGDRMAIEEVCYQGNDGGFLYRITLILEDNTSRECYFYAKNSDAEKNWYFTDHLYYAW